MIVTVEIIIVAIIKCHVVQYVQNRLSSNRPWVHYGRETRKAEFDIDRDRESRFLPVRMETEADEFSRSSDAFC